MNAQDVKRVAVIGAGTMGHSIAQVFAQAGIEVNLTDIKKDLLDHAMRLVEGNLNTLVDLGRLKKDTIGEVLRRIHPTTELPDAAKGVDFVLEAVVEIPDVKRKVFSQLEESCPPGTVLASNTSGLEIFKIIEAKDPSRLVAAHWYAPPHIIPLVEVAPGPGTSPATLQFTADLMKRIGKRPIVMKKFVQRFIVNRVQNAIIFCVLEMLENGWATPEDIDMAVKTSLGIRLPIVGVIQSLDFNGLQLVNDVLKSQGKDIPLIADKVKKGHLGASTSKGIYDYGKRTEAEILRKRDELFFNMLDHLEKIGAFEPV